MKTSTKIIFAICAGLLITFSCITANASDDPPKTLEEYCKTAPCIKNHSFRLKKKDGTYFEYTSELDPPVVQPEFILIFPEEELFIEATEGKDAFPQKGRRYELPGIINSHDQEKGHYEVHRFLR